MSPGRKFVDHWDSKRVAIGTSMGLSPQSGLPQNNRVGDLDSFALPFLMRSQI